MTKSDRWTSIPSRIDAALAEEAKQAIWPLISEWMTDLLDYPGFRDWKTESIARKLKFSALPDSPVEDYPDFPFPDAIIMQHEIVSGYIGLVSAAFDCRMTRDYFRRYPFSKLDVTRSDHLRTCCELYYSRVYLFGTRLEKQLNKLSRRTKPKGLNTDEIMKQFNSHCDIELAARHRIHHDAEYSDFEIDSLRVSDLLSGNANITIRMSKSGYHSIAKRWQQRVLQTSDKLDLWVGYVAILMLVRCSFLRGAETHQA